MRRTRAFLLGGGGFLVGLFLGNYAGVSLGWIGFTVIASFLIMLIFWKQPIVKRLAVFVLLTLAGWSYVVLWRSVQLANLPFNNEVVTTAEVVTCTSARWQYRCILASQKPFKGRVVATFDNKFSPGTIAVLKGKLAPVDPESRFLLADGVAGMLLSPQIVSASERPRSTRSLLYGFKKTSETHLAQALPEPASSLSSGLLFGSRQQFNRDFLEALRKTNTLHIVAVSGFNITILVEFIRQLLGRFSRKTVFFLSSLAIVGFVLMIGAPASAVRAAIMGIILLFGTLIGRKPYIPSMILFTALLMVIPNPYLLRHDLGFQLSFLAFAGLVGLAPLIEPRLVFVPKPLRTLLAATLGATLATTPRLIPLTSEVSLIGPLVNILILPVIPLVMLLASITLFASSIFPILGQVFGFLLYLPGLWVVGVIEKGAQLPLATVNWILAIAILFILGIVFSLFRRRHVPLR